MILKLLLFRCIQWFSTLSHHSFLHNVPLNSQYMVCLVVFPGTMKVISARFSKCGSPLVVLATRHAFLFDMSLKCWLRVADDCFPASNFSSSWSSGLFRSGELAALQVDVGKYLARKPSWSRYVQFKSTQSFEYTIPKD